MDLVKKSAALRGIYKCRGDQAAEEDISGKRLQHCSGRK